MRKWSMRYSEAARPSATVVMTALAPFLDVTSSLLNYIINVLYGVMFFSCAAQERDISAA